MDIEDDFIEDSDESDQSEEDYDDIFLTKTRVDPPREIVLKPAVNIYPIASLTQNLLSKMYSLQMFGTSDIGSSVPGSVYDLGKHLKKMINTFPIFIKESNVIANSQQFILQKKFDSIKTRIQNSQQINKQLKERIRTNERQLPNLNRSNDDTFSELDRAKSEMKATACSLKKYIIRLKGVKQENDQMQAENQEIQKQIDDLLAHFRRNCSGDIGKLNKNIVKTEIEIKENIKRHKENLLNAQEIINSYNDPIHSLEIRLSDMNRRVSVLCRQVRGTNASKYRK